MEYLSMSITTKMQPRISKFFQVKSKTIEKSFCGSISTSNAITIDLTDDGSNHTDSVSEAPISIPLLERSYTEDPLKRIKLHQMLFSVKYGELDGENPLPASEHLSTSSTSRNTFTPLEKQVMAIRQNYPDSLLMVECGYRMRFFGPDAIAASKILSIFAHPDHNFMVASIPTHRAFIHCQRLLTAGHKVAIVRQMETAALRKNSKASSGSTFERSVVGVFTEGTLIDDDDPAFEGLQKTNSYCKTQADQDDSDDGEYVDDGEILLEEPSTICDDIWVACILESIHGDSTEEFTTIAAINIRAHELWIEVIPMDRLRQGLKDHLDILKPSEVILCQDCSSFTMGCLQDRLANINIQDKPSGYIKRLKVLPTNKFTDDIPQVLSQCGDWLQSQKIETQRTICGLFQYLSEFGLQEALGTPTLVHSDSRVSHDGTSSSSSHANAHEQSFALDGVTIRDLEVFDSLGNSYGKLKRLGEIVLGSNRGRSGKRVAAGLFGLIDNCRSVYGRRTLKRWIMRPLLERTEIMNRHEAIEWAMKSACRQSVSFASQWRQIIIDLITNFPDVESMLTSLQYNRISPSRLVKLLTFGSKLSSLCYVLDDKARLQEFPVLFQRWLQGTKPKVVSTDAVAFLNHLANHSTDVSVGLSGIFTAAAEQEMEQLSALRDEQDMYLKKLNAELMIIRKQLNRPQLAFTTLRTGALSQIEHLIELPLKDEKLISTDDGHWIKVSSTKQVVRFHNRTILSIQDELYRIRDQIKIVSQVEWRIFCGKAKDILYDPLRAAICMLGNIDAILSLSIVAQQYPNYCKPEYPENSQLMIVHQGRHPMLERIVEDQGNMFLPNDVQISQQFLKKSCQVVTGPNMGGKSSYVRMIALIALLGQIGSYVPAEYASLCLFDNIFTRMGAEDDISSGKSTFMCELIRTNKILQNSTSSSLVIIDELGRGTATNDGQAIAEATLDHIIHRIGCATLFITHFQHLANLVESSAYGDQAFNSHMSFVENTNEEGEKEVVFLYKSVNQPSQGSHGINVARLAGIPNHVLKRAVEMSQWMQSNSTI